MSKELIEDLRAVSETGCDPDLPFRAADLIEAQEQEQELQAMHKLVEDTAKSYARASGEAAALRTRIDELTKLVSVQSRWEDRYNELLGRARRVYRFYGVNDDMVDASVRDMDSLIQRHQREISDEDDDIDCAVAGATRRQR